MNYEFRSQTGAVVAVSLDKFSRQRYPFRLVLNWTSASGTYQPFRSNFHIDFSYNDLGLQFFTAGLTVFQAIDVSFGLEGRVILASEVAKNEQPDEELSLNGKISDGLCGRIAVPLKLRPGLFLTPAYCMFAPILSESTSVKYIPSLKSNVTLGVAMDLMKKPTSAEE